jgi:hypothetical protein
MKLSLCLRQRHEAREQNDKGTHFANFNFDLRSNQKKTI